MASLFDAVQADRQNHRTPCHVAALLKTLPKDLQRDLLTLLADADVSAPEIVRGLESVGHPVAGHRPERYVSNHRAGRCTCK